MARPVILINPLSSRGVGDRSLPMGLLAASTLVADHYRVELIDQRIEQRQWKARFASLLEEDPICVGVTAMTGRQILAGLDVSRMVKRSARCPVVWGGIHASLLPEQTLENEWIDYVVEGEGEVSFHALVKALDKGRDPSGILGLWHKPAGRPESAGPREFVAIGDLPLTPYRLLKLEDYIFEGEFGRTLTFFTSRGCPQRCAFCYNRRFNRSRWRVASVERIGAEIRTLAARHRLSHVQFWDDNFFVHLGRAKGVAETIRTWKPLRSWSVLGAHVRDLARMDDATLRLFAGSGLKEVVVGIESGSQRIVDRIRKNFRVEELFEVNRRLGTLGIRPTYSFMSGFPGEDDEDLKETIRVMMRLERESPDVIIGNIKPFVCYPGTELYETALDRGFRPPEKLEDWSEYFPSNYLNLAMPWVSRERQKRLSALYFYTVLMNPRYLFLRSKGFELIARVLGPGARWRVRRFNFTAPVVARLLDRAQRLLL